jgi:hypothetical protein
MEKIETMIQGEEQADNSESITTEVNWTESEWFQDWLRLARRDYHGRRVIEKPPRKN